MFPLILSLSLSVLPPQAPRPPQAPELLHHRHEPVLPAKSVRFCGTGYTQSIDRMDYGDRRGLVRRILPVQRHSLDAKWRVPGGMEGVSGWKVEKYRSVPGPVRTWIGEISVLNSSREFQKEHGLLRSYPDGTRFDEVLRNGQGDVFEHRVAVKERGQWKRYVEHKDENARPKGYAGLKQSCASCHNEAGTGKYGVGLVPGGDTVLSDPLDWTLVGHQAEESEEQPRKPTLEVAEEPLPYKDARWLALKDGKPLIVFVRQAARPVEGCVVARFDNYEPDAVTMVVSTRIGDELYEFRRLMGTPSPGEIKAAVEESQRKSGGGEQRGVRDFLEQLAPPEPFAGVSRSMPSRSMLQAGPPALFIRGRNSGC